MPPVRASAPTPAPASAQEEKLEVHIVEVKLPKRTSQLRQQGLRALVSCSARCKVDVGTVVARSTAHRVALGTTEVGHASAVLGGGQQRWVVARPAPGACSKLVEEAGATASLGLRAQVQAREMDGSALTATISKD